MIGFVVLSYYLYVDWKVRNKVWVAATRIPLLILLLLLLNNTTVES